jgi:hypothetical protein
MTLSRLVASAAVPIALAALLALASPAAAQTPLGDAPNVAPFGHDDSLDGNAATERVSGLFPGDDGDNTNGDPLADRGPLTYEAFEFRVPEGANIGSFTVTVTWQDPRLDLDLYIYRKHPTLGTIAPTAIASSASFGDTDEAATYYNAIASEPIEPDTYVIVVDNWCTKNDDPAVPPGGCGITDEMGNPVDVPDEDDFVGTVTFGPRLATNLLPGNVALAGPDAVKQGTAATFTASATDDGTIDNFAFDLDGDGRFELDNGTNAAVTKRFDTPGWFNIGVRVTDNQGGRSYKSRELQVQAPPIKQLVSRFSLNRPVFGGRKRSSLKVTYRVREAANVTLDLYRGSKRIRRLVRNKARTAEKTYSLTIKAKGKRRGSYTVRLRARTAAGRTQSARLAAQRL